MSAAAGNAALAAVLAARPEAVASYRLDPKSSPVPSSI
jgi:hypothetical protein